MVQIKDFSRLSAENLEYFLEEMYGDISAKADHSQVSLADRQHNLPETCIEMNMEKLSFLHSMYGPKIFEICGATSPFAEHITRLSFLTKGLPLLFSSRVFQKSMMHMKQLKEISLVCSHFYLKDWSIINVSNCESLRILTLDLAISKQSDSILN